MTSFRARSYGAEQAAASLGRHSARFHPLDSSRSNVEASRHSVEFATPSLVQDEESVAVFNDPLRSTAVPDLPSTTMKASRKGTRVSMDHQVSIAAADWDAYKLTITQRFASTGTVTISSAFDVITKDHKARSNMSAISAHLQELDDPEKSSIENVKVLTQQEYVTRLKELKEEIAEAWMNNERVSALKLSVKVAKLLSDTTVPEFYPTLFVLVTDVMDTVGDLVWDRIKQKAGIEDVLPANFPLTSISQEAKDTCRNWFFKIGSIKDLLPRIYLEVAILRCMQFLEDDLTPTFQRLSLMMRGLADPLASAYARIYLSRKGLALLPQETGYLVSGIHDFSILLYRAVTGEFDQKFSNLHIQKQMYLALLEPMFEWILHCLFKYIKQEETQNLVVALCGKSERKPLAVLVHYLLKQLSAEFVGNHAMEITRLVKSSLDISVGQSDNFVLLGRKLCECPPPRELQLQVLNAVWKANAKTTNLVEYVAVATAFTDYILQCCSETELVVMLRDLKKRLNREGSNHKVQSSLESILVKLISHYSDFTHVLALEGFVDIVDFIHGDTKLNVYKSILTATSKNNAMISDPVSRNFLFEAAKVLHDSLDNLSIDDDRRQIARLLARYVQLVDHGRELEHHLDFLVECRATFSSMDSVREAVVHVSNRIAVSALKLGRRSHSERTIDFVKACVTFNEITIPSITNVTTRVQLFLETGEVALMNGLLSHVESLLKSGILCLQEIQTEDWRPQYESELLRVFLNLCSFLIVVPGDPELGALYFLRGLVNLLDSKPWLFKGRRKLQILVGFLLTVSTLSQDQLPYHVGNDQVDSNDMLYVENDSYKTDMSSFGEMLLDRISAVIDHEQNPVQQGYMLLDASNAFVLAYGVAGEMGQKTAALARKAKLMLPKEHSYLAATEKLIALKM